MFIPKFKCISGLADVYKKVNSRSILVVLMNVELHLQKIQRNKMYEIFKIFEYSAKFKMSKMVIILANSSSLVIGVVKF